MIGASRAGRRTLLLVAAGTVTGLLAIAILFRLDAGDAATPRGRAPSVPPTDLLAPAPLTEEERRAAAKGFEAGGAVALEAGAWVQVADEDGRLAQEYSAERVDPRPDRWVRLERPQAILHARDGRVVTLVAERGEARIPGRALESGTLERGVTVELFRPVAGKPVDRAVDRPALVIEAELARFDGVLGELRCDRSVRISAGESSFAGEGLVLLLDGEGRGVERLTVRRLVEPARFVRRATAAAPAGAPVAPAPAGARPSAKPEGPVRFYRLVAEGDVRIRRWLGTRFTALDGDRLEAIFSLEEAGRDPLLAVGPEPPVATVPGGMRGALVAAAIAASPDPDGPPLPLGPDDELALLSCSGPIVMVPLAADDPDRPGSPEAFVVELSGREVRLEDAETGTEVRAGRLRFRFEDDSFLAERSEAAPLRIRGDRLAAEGRSLTLSRRDGRGVFLGPGAVDLGEGGEHLETMAAGSDARLAEAGEPKAVRISFRDRVDLELAPDTADTAGALRSATFREVEARGPDFVLAGTELAARFSAGRDLRELEVLGTPIVAERRGEPGSLRTRRMLLSLTPDAEGRPSPARLVTEGGTVVADVDAALRARRLEVGFVETAADRREIGPVVAEGEVAIALADRVRAWGGRLEADAPARTVRIESGDAPDGVAIAREGVLLDRLGSVRFEETRRFAAAAGPGRVRAFAESLVGEGKVPDPRPAPAGTPTLLAEWSDGFEFEETDAGGELRVGGGVRVRATPDASATDALDADRVRLTLAPTGAGDERAVRSFVATGERARLESRRWADAARSGDPRLFRLQGAEIRYRPVDREGEVPGAGNLLLHVPAGSRDAPRPIAPGGTSLGAEGTSRFSWTRELTLRRVEGDRYRIELDGEVEVLHAGERPGETLSLRATRLGIDLRRPDAADDASVDLGGTAELRGLDASGGVTARTGDFDLSCERLRYDTESQVATLVAAPGRTVGVVFRNGAPPIRAAEVRWDLATGEIRAVDVAGGR